MKRVLIICGTFPPQSDIGGLRPAMFAKYLPEYNWDPWILTRDFSVEDNRYNELMPLNIEIPNEQIIRVKYPHYCEEKYIEDRNVFSLILDFFYPEYSNPPGLYFKVKERARQLIKEQHFDLVFATAPDQWELTLGAWISKVCKIPFVADFRDIKEQEDGILRSNRERMLVKRNLLRRYLSTKNASAITTVSKFHLYTLQRKLKKKTTLIYNGFDESIFKAIDCGNQKKSTFRIIYTGRIINKWYQNPEILFESLKQLIEEGKLQKGDISIDFYGTDPGILESLCPEVVFKNFLQVFPRIPFKDVALKLNDAQLLLLLTDKGRKGILTTKFFEYAGVKKPLLCIPGDGGELDSLIDQLKIGESISDIALLKDKLLNWVEDFKSGVYPAHISSVVEYFSRKNQTKLLAELFDSLL